MREKLSETELPHSFKPVIRFSKCKKFRKDAAGRYLKAAFDGLIMIFNRKRSLIGSDQRAFFMPAAAGNLPESDLFPV